MSKIEVSTYIDDRKRTTFALKQTIADDSIMLTFDVDTGLLIDIKPIKGNHYEPYKNINDCVLIELFRDHENSKHLYHFLETAHKLNGEYI